ncbi:MAG: preprotein translocase subunit SecG [Proteobacteria bacterium]|nr:preprotein translocase subunit SecG [Pseudomonadota bacterium]
MESIHTLLFVLQVVVAVALIGFILIQHGKGADAGAAFGSGSSSTVFGSSGSGSFLTKVTTGLVIIFLGNSLLLAYLASQNMRQVPTSLLDKPGVVMEQEIGEQDIPVAIEEQSENQDSDLPSLPIE